jgi:hypothetical protein
MSFSLGPPGGPGFPGPSVRIFTQKIIFYDLNICFVGFTRITRTQR